MTLLSILIGLVLVVLNASQITSQLRLLMQIKALGLPVGAVMNCADNTGAKNLYIMAVKCWHPSPAAHARASHLARVGRRCGGMPRAAPSAARG